MESNQPKIFVTSDLHLLHNRSFIYEPRGFRTIEEHNETVIKNINETVAAGDILYILGDLMLMNNDAGIELLKQINCENIYIALGNHDTDVRAALYQGLPHIKDIQMAYRIKSGKWSFVLSHYPQKTKNGDDPKKIYSLAGHVHAMNKWLDWDMGCYHVELDAHNNYPISLDQIKEDIINKKEER